ncbi:MAG: CPBP family intramembrane metalloprotease [Chloroflexi bacterium]|nr:CPBP family intramembrane metalloprotease [Chloroflexota bacterium]
MAARVAARRVRREQLLLGLHIVGAILTWSLGMALGGLAVLAYQRLEGTDYQKGPFATFELLPPFLCSFVALLVYTRIVERRPAISLGLQPANAGMMWLRGAVVGAVLMGCITLVWLTILAGSTIRGNGYADRALAALIVAFVVFLIQGPSEELLFRGFILQTVSRGWGAWWGVAVSALLFGGLHVLNPHFGPLAAVNLVLFGVAAAFYKLFVDGSMLWGVFGIHTMWNYMQEFVFGLPNSGTAAPPGNVLFQLQPDQTRADWIWGGGFGPEGTLAATIVLAVLAIGCLLEGRARHGSIAAAMRAAQAHETEVSHVRVARTRFDRRRGGRRIPVQRRSS